MEETGETREETLEEETTTAKIKEAMAEEDFHEETVDSVGEGDMTIKMTTEEAEVVVEEGAEEEEATTEEEEATSEEATEATRTTETRRRTTIQRTSETETNSKGKEMSSDRNNQLLVKLPWLAQSQLGRT